MREAVINRQHFLVIEDEWFSLVEAGEKMNLLQKASAVQDGIQYNGTAPVGTGRSKGMYGDYFLQRPSDPDSLILVTKKNLDAIVNQGRALKDLRELAKQFNDCP